MCSATKTIDRRGAFTLIELLVVIGIILVIAALAAAFAPRVSDSQNLTRSVDQLEQWLLTAKMRAKRDQLATGLRFVPAQGDTAGTCSQFQYIQQPDPLAGGAIVFVPTGGTPPPGGTQYQTLPTGTLYLTGGICMQTTTQGQVQLYNVDCSMGQTLTANQYLIQAGDYLEVRDAGVYQIMGASASNTNPPVTTVQLGNSSTNTTSTYDTSLSVSAATTNYRILRQPRILIGEAPLQLPNNFAVDTTLVPAAIIPGNSLLSTPPIYWSNVQAGPSVYLEILFSPSGAVVGTNAGSGKVLMTVYDMTMTPFDPSRAGIVGVQGRTGFIGAYSLPLGTGLPGYDPFAFVESGRESGL